ncbi:acyl-CoA dehydrogenase family protein [Glaciimonas sp. GNP009]
MNREELDEDRAFRAEVRAFCLNNVPDTMRARVRSGMRPSIPEWRQWQQTLFRHGWGAPSWPKEWGGTGWSPTQLHIFEQEAARADAPPQFHQGLELIGPIIFTFGTTEQKARYLPRILSGEDWWCQGYSEPGAGSDLAAIRTKAILEDSEYIVNGQKLWTSYAQAATMMFCLVRTDSAAKKQAGISLLLIDMKTPGIKVRPILTLDEEHHVNEVFFDDVRVPVADLLGEEGKGWSYGKVLLDRERGATATLSARLARQLEYVRERAGTAMQGQTPLIQNADFKTKLAQLEIEVIALEYLGLRTLADVVAGIDSGPRGSMMKVRWSELLQKITELWIETLGYDAARFEALDSVGAEDIYASSGPMMGYLYSRVTTIYGGSNEIQRNIIARRSLGL